MKVRRIAPLAVFLAASLQAQERAYVENLAPDQMNVSPAEFKAAVDSLVAGASMQRSGRASLNLTGDSATHSFLVPSAANVAGDSLRSLLSLMSA